MFNSDDGLVPVVVETGFDPVRARVAMGGFLGGYSGKTLEAYALDLRQWSRWCLDHHLDLFDVRRAHIELFAHWLEETGRAKSTVARRLSTITGFYRYCTEEQLIVLQRSSPLAASPLKRADPTVLKSHPRPCTP